MDCIKYTYGIMIVIVCYSIAKDESLADAIAKESDIKYTFTHI